MAHPKFFFFLLGTLLLLQCAPHCFGFSVHDLPISEVEDFGKAISNIGTSLTRLLKDDPAGEVPKFPGVNTRRTWPKEATRGIGKRVNQCTVLNGRLKGRLKLMVELRKRMELHLTRCDKCLQQTHQIRDCCSTLNEIKTVWADSVTACVCVTPGIGFSQFAQICKPDLADSDLWCMHQP